MAKNTKIEWAHHTFNPWIGCTKVGPGCDNCYAESDFDKRRHVVQWGPNQPRKRTAPSTWAQPLRWNKMAEAEGTRYRVFCGSLCDWADNEVDPQWRTELFELIRSTPNLDWLLLTKRISNAAAMIDAALLNTDIGYSVPFAAWPWPNVWIGATITSQAEADREIPKLLAVPAAKRFLSLEPLLGPVDLVKAKAVRSMCKTCASGQSQGCIIGQPGPFVDWVIVGGESGPNARPMHPDWARSLRDQCQAAGVPFLFKQWGEWLPVSQMNDSDHRKLYRSKVKAKQHESQAEIDDVYGRTCTTPDTVIHMDGSTHEITEPQAFIKGAMHTFKVGKKAAGRLLDGREWNEFPQV